MSSYEDYTSKSSEYDLTRQPIGTEVIAGCFAAGPRPLSEMAVLDAGCGTGSYSRALAPLLGRIEALDANASMLEVAAQKLAEAGLSDRVDFRVGTVDALPFADASFDGVTINQVLHHLGDDPERGFPLHRRVFAEFARVLRPGGVLVVNTCSQEQVTHGYWYYELIAEAAARLRRRYMPVEDVAQALSGSGLTYRGRFAPIDQLLQGKSYLDPRGPLREEWRNGESTWSLATPGELEQALQRVRDLEEQGELDRAVERFDRRRREIGQITFLFSTRG